MSDFLSGLNSAWAATSNIEIVAVVFGVFYILLAAKENSWCWPAAFIGTGTSIYLFWDGKLLMESALNLYYLAMAVYGWWQWQYGGKRNNAKQISIDEKPVLHVSTWPIKNHLIAFGLIAILSLGSGYLLSQKTSAELPYLDSFTTWSAVITTWMVTRKILENWLYWIVINSASIYLFIDREFFLYAVLYAAYIIIAVFGYLQWRNSLEQISSLERINSLELTKRN